MLSAWIEPGCPSLSMAFDAISPDFSSEIYVQGAYAFVATGRVPVNAVVSSIQIDSLIGDFAKGSFVLSFPGSSSPAGFEVGTEVSGEFALCTQVGSTVEPCRNMHRGLQ